MVDPFHAAVDPIFLAVLDARQRIEAGETVSPSQTREEVVDRLEHADALIGGGTEWELTRYALIAWTDEVMLDTDWDGRDWWTNNALEADLIGSRDCSERFYQQAEQARALPDTHVLEVFYACVVLGFRGMYRSGSIGDSFGRRDGLPDTLDAWLRRMALTIEKRRPAPPSIERLAVGAAPRTARAWFIGSGFALLTLLILNAIVHQFHAA